MMIFAKSKRALKALARDESGNSLIEFAFMLPIFMSISLAGAETINLVQTHMRVSQIAHVTADNVARIRERIDVADINDVFFGVNQVGGTIQPLTNGRIAISLIEKNLATPANLTDDVILWQRCKGLKTLPTNLGVEGTVLASGIGLPGKPQASAATGNPIVFVEVYYEYKPFLDWVKPMFGETMPIRYTSAYTIRDRQLNTLQNAQGLSGSSLSTCNYYNTSLG